MVDIAICGKDVRFCRMLELELSALGFSVVREPHGVRARLWVVDLDTAVPPTNGRCIGITADGSLADDACCVVLRRPFPMDALRAEVLGLLRDAPLPAPPAETDAMLCDLGAQEGFVLCGKPLALSETEALVLRALYARRGEVVPRAELCALLGSETNPKLADVYVCLLRRKLEAGGTARLLFTVRGVGYRLAEET